VRRLQSLALVFGALAVPSQAYYHYVHYSSRNAPFTPQYEKYNVKSVTFMVSDQGPAVFAANDTFGSLLGQVKQALAAWDSVSTSDLRVVFGGLEAKDQPSNTPGGDVVFDDLSLYPRYLQILGASGIPWHHCPGNHDIDSEARARCRRTRAPRP